MVTDIGILTGNGHITDTGPVVAFFNHMGPHPVLSRKIRRIRRHLINLQPFVSAGDVQKAVGEIQTADPLGPGGLFGAQLFRGGQADADPGDRRQGRSGRIIKNGDSLAVPVKNVISDLGHHIRGRRRPAVKIGNRTGRVGKSQPGR